MTDPVIGPDFYDRSGYFDAGGRHLTELDSPFHQYRVAGVRELCGPVDGERVVDLGCGWGTITLALAPEADQVVGVDFSARALEMCREESRRRGVENVAFVQADAGATGLEAASWDLVVAADLVEHLYPDDARRVYREVFRLLRPGGRFALWTPHRGHILEILRNRNLFLKRDVSHVDYKSMESLRRGLSDAGLQVVRAYYAPSHLPGLRTVERLLQPLVPQLRRRIALLARKPSG